MIIFKDNTYLQIVCWNSLISNSIVNTKFSELSIHSQMNVQTMPVYAMSTPPELNSANTVIWIAMTRTHSTGVPDVQVADQAEKSHCQISWTMTNEK